MEELTVRHHTHKALSTATAAIALECCHPACFAPAQARFATQVSLCELHIMDVYKATNKFVLVEKQKNDEYSLLPMEQDMIAGPCPACGLCGYLTSTVTKKVRCLNASCQYEAYVDQFERLRRNLLFAAANTLSVVYYIKFRDRVKIGTTANLKARVQGIQTVELLYGFERGNRDLERQRHEQFAIYRDVGEWFDDNPRIRAHINEVCAIA